MRLRALRLAALAPLALLALNSPAQETKGPKPNNAEIVEKIRGDYSLRGGTVDGNPMTADRVANVSVKITERTITTYDGQREQRFSASYQLLNDKRPWQVTLKSVKKITSGESTKEKVEQSEGIMDVSEDGKMLRLAYATEGSERPKDFKGGKNQNVFEMRRLDQAEKAE